MATRRIVVAGGTGFFGSAAVELLRADGHDPVVASRRGPVRLDVGDAASIRAALREDDVVLDAAGPFQDRTTALVEVADGVGFDVVDLSDSLAYCERILARRARRLVLTACSSVSAVTAAFLSVGGVEAPRRISTFLGPETRHASRPGAGTSLLRSIGRPIRALAAGRVVARVGWRSIRRIRAPAPVGPLECREFESADVATLPPSFPSLRDIDFWVDTRIGAVNRFFSWAADAGLAHLLEGRRVQALSLPLVRRMGPEGGFLGSEIEGDGHVARVGLVSGRKGTFTPVVPAVLAVERIAGGRFSGAGVVRADRQVDPGELFARLDRLGIRLVRIP